jgi:hypothetical protein
MNLISQFIGIDSRLVACVLMIAIHEKRDGFHPIELIAIS